MIKKEKEKIKLSVVVIARNEQEMIKECLDSVAWVDERILLDTGSVDKTAKIAQEAGARVMELGFSGYDFSEWRNRAIKETKSDWLFYLDADERVTPLLKEEILRLIKKGKFSAYSLPRRNFYLGKEMHFGGAWPDYVIRLFKKEKLKNWQDRLHEQPVFEGELAQLTNPLVHLTHRDLDSMLKKTIDWTKIEAELLLKANHPPVVCWRVVRMMLAKFWQRVVKQQAWRDGSEGWINALFEVFNTFIIYIRLWESQNLNKGNHKISHGLMK